MNWFQWLLIFVVLISIHDMVGDIASELARQRKDTERAHKEALYGKDAPQ